MMLDCIYSGKEHFSYSRIGNDQGSETTMKDRKRFRKSDPVTSLIGHMFEKHFTTCDQINE